MAQVLDQLNEVQWHVMDMRQGYQIAQHQLLLDVLMLMMLELGVCHGEVSGY